MAIATRPGDKLSVGVDDQDGRWITPLDPGLSDHPYLYMNGHGNVHFTEAECAALRAYLAPGAPPVPAPVVQAAAVVGSDTASAASPTGSAGATDRAAGEPG